MRLTLNEVQLLALRAARGCRLHEGLCEDLARAAAWLCAAGLDGVGAGLAAMQAPGARQPAACGEHHGQWVFEAASAAVAGPSAIDLSIADCGRRVLLTRVDAPLLLLGHAGVAAHDYHCTLRLGDDRGQSALVADGALAWDDPRSPGLSAERVHIEHAGADETPQRIAARVHGVEVDDADVAAIRVLAARVCVPASAASRTHGAGAGLVDSD